MLPHFLRKIATFRSIAALATMAPPRHHHLDAFRIWPVAEMTAGRRGGRFLGSICRRRARPTPVDGRVALLASGIETSSSMPVAKLDGSV
jgi:hypothetical protein